MKLLYQTPHGWHWQDTDGTVYFIESKTAFDKLKKEREGK